MTQDLAYDLIADILAADQILTKIQNDNTYAQNLYEALCTSSFQKNIISRRRKDIYWTCTPEDAAKNIAQLRNEDKDWASIDVDRSGRKKSGMFGIFHGDLNTISDHADAFLIDDELRQDLFGIDWVVWPSVMLNK